LRIEAKDEHHEHHEQPKQVIDCDTCLKEQNLASTSSVKLQECFELLAETVQAVFGGPELP